MELFMLASTTVTFLAFFIASCMFVYCDGWLKTILVLVSAAVFAVIKLGGARIFPEKSDLFRRYLACALGACAVAGVYSLVVFEGYYGRFADMNGVTDSVQVRIERCDYSLSYMARYEAVVTESGQIPENTRILLSTEHIGLEEGAVLEGSVLYSVLSEASSSGFNAERYYLPKRIMLTAEEEELTVTGHEKRFSVSGLFHKLNERLTVAILAHTKREYGGTAAAVLLGNKEYLADQTSRDFRRLGVSHLLVVSGTHFSVLLAFASHAMIRMRVNRRKRAWISIVLILLFMALTGFSASVLRAGIMYLIAQIALLADRRVNYLHSLAFAGSAIVLFQPFAAMDCGLQLSFTAAYSCLLYNSLRVQYIRHRREQRKLSGKPRKPYTRPAGIVRILKNIAGVLGLTCVVNIAIFPLIWLYFGEISLLSLLSNVLFIPMVTGLMYLAGLFLLQYPLGFLTFHLGKAINGYCAFMLGLAEAMAEWEHIMVPVNYKFSAAFLLPLTLMIILIPFVSTTWHRFCRIAAGILAVLTAFFGTVGIVSVLDRPNVYFSYVTQSKNDGFVLKSDGKILFCDVSDGSYGYLYELTDEMLELYSCEVETLVLTHYHNKHLQYLGRLCDREVLRNLVLPEPIDERELGLYQSLVNTAEREGVQVHTVSVGETYSFGDTEILLHERMYLSRSTHPVTAVSVTAYGNTTTMLSCSFNQSHEEITDWAEKSDILIFGHHSPVYKKAFDLSFDKKPKAVVMSDAALEYMSEELAESLVSAEMFREPEEWCVRTDRTGNCTIVQGRSEKTAESADRP